MAVLIDANIFSAMFKGNVKLTHQVHSIGPVINTIVWIELMQGSINRAQRNKIEKVLSRIPIIHFDNRISAESMRLIKLHSNSHGLMLADAIIAASCLVNNLPLLTFNARDFNFIGGLKLAAI